MPDFPQLPIITPPDSPSPRPLPSLPIVTPDPPRKRLRDKYGGLFYLGIAGLAFTLLLIGAFGYGIWATRELWVAVYVLSDPSRSDPERVLAAWRLAHDPAINDKIRVDQGFRKDRPDLARYVLLEGLTSEAIRSDPKAYALMVSRSDDWPGWFRLLMTRPMAYGANDGYRIAWEPLDELRANPDRSTALWATYARAVMGAGDANAAAELAAAAKTTAPSHELAALLDEATRLKGDDQKRKLDEATRWLRTHHPLAREVWKGWEERDGALMMVDPQ